MANDKKHNTEIDASEVQIMKSNGIRLTEIQLQRFLDIGYKLEIKDGKKTLYKPIN